MTISAKLQDLRRFLLALDYNITHSEDVLDVKETCHRIVEAIGDLANIFEDYANGADYE